MTEYQDNKIKLLENKVSVQNQIIDSYKLLYSIQESLMKGKAIDTKKLSELEQKINIMYEVVVK